MPCFCRLEVSQLIPVKPVHLQSYWSQIAAETTCLCFKRVLWIHKKKRTIFQSIFSENVPHMYTKISSGPRRNLSATLTLLLLIILLHCYFSFRKSTFIAPPSWHSLSCSFIPFTVVTVHAVQYEHCWCPGVHQASKQIYTTTVSNAPRLCSSVKCAIGSDVTGSAGLWKTQQKQWGHISIWQVFGLIIPL
jgi:hypothetical protein